MTGLATLDVSERGGVVTARIKGDLDLSNLPAIRTGLFDAVPGEARGLVVDLSEVGFLDSAGVETLFRLHEALDGRRQLMAVVVPAQATIRRALELSGAADELIVTADARSAAAALRAAEPSL